MTRKRFPKRTLIWVLLGVGFAAMEFPGVFLFADRAEPFLFGMPFTYGYIILWWLYMCAVLLYAYRVRWGRAPHAEVADEH